MDETFQDYNDGRYKYARLIIPTSEQSIRIVGELEENITKSVEVMSIVASQLPSFVNPFKVTLQLAVYMGDLAREEFGDDFNYLLCYNNDVMETALTPKRLEYFDHSPRDAQRFDLILYKVKKD
jgi:hypothetical protein